jgi:hypothetical protein
MRRMFSLYLVVRLVGFLTFSLPLAFLFQSPSLPHLSRNSLNRPIQLNSPRILSPYRFASSSTILEPTRIYMYLGF